jgi:porin
MNPRRTFGISGLMVLLATAPISAQVPPPDTARGGFEGPASTGATIARDGVDKDPFWKVPINLFDPWQRAKASVEESIGVTYGVQYQSMYAKASTSIGGAEESSASGIFALTAAWTAYGQASGNVGRLTVRVDNRHVYGDYTTSPQLLAFQTGTMAPTATMFGSAPTRPMVLYWAQGLFGGRAGFVVGKLFPDDYLNHHQLMNPLTDFFGLGSVFAPSMHLPNPGVGVGVGGWVANQFQVKVLVTDASGDLYGDDFWDPGFDNFRDGNLYKAAELLWIPDAANPYSKRVSITTHHVDGYENSTMGRGVSLASNWTVGRWVPLFLAGVSNGGGANAVAETFVTLGTGYRLRSQDVTGATVSWLNPPGSDLRNQLTTEFYFRFYLSDALAVSPNLQWVIHPALNTDVGSMTYFQIRTRIAL